jgi:hypothetical protein
MLEIFVKSKKQPRTSKSTSSIPCGQARSYWYWISIIVRSAQNLLSLIMSRHSLAILDTKPLTSGSLPASQCARPGLHEFLEAIYPYYDSKWHFLLCFIQILTVQSLRLVIIPNVRLHLYQHICCRSQTSWIWLEAKLVELEMIGAQRTYEVRQRS